MQLQTIDFSRPLALKYLQLIEALTQEIRTGMDAVGGNALAALQQSVSRQQELCNSLCRLNGQMSIEKAMRAPDGESQGVHSSSDQALADRIRVAADSLQALNHSYAALLKHSKESVRLFAGLCQSYTEHFERPTVSSASRSRWSCES